MKPPPYDWSILPPASQREYRLKIERAPAVGDKMYGILSDEVTGVFLHWNGRRNIGCQGKEFCEFCQAGKGRKWRGYLASITSGVKFVRLLELTAEQLDGFFLAFPAVEPEELRGLTLKVKRSGQYRKAPPVLELVPVPRVASDQLPPAPDVRTELHRIWSTP